MTDEFRIYCDEILGSSPRMTKKVKSGDDIVGNFRILVIASEAKQSLGILEFLPRNSRFRNSRFILRNSRIPYYVILGLAPRISIWNSRIP